jgi:hypothetical protein
MSDLIYVLAVFAGGYGFRLLVDFFRTGDL